MTGPTSPHLLLLAGVGGHAPQEALASIRSIGAHVSLVYIDAWAPADAVRTVFDTLRPGGELVVVHDLAEAVEAAVALHARQPIHGVVTYSELLLLPHAQIAARLALPGSPPEAVAIAQSKARQREVFARCGVATPRFAIVDDAAQIDAAIACVGLPAVFKPSLGAGSVGVQRVETRAQALAAWRAFSAQRSTFLQPDPHVLLEEPLALEGNDGSAFADYVSVESLLVDGQAQHLTVTDRGRLCHGYVEEGLVMPSRLDAQAQQRIVAEADKAIRAIGLTHGAVHTEVAWVGGEAKIIEVNARAGGPVPSMFKAAAGYNYAAEIARSALGQRSSTAPAFGRIAWHRFVPIPDGQWRIASMTPVDEVKQRFAGRIVYLSPRFKVGQTVNRALTLHLASFLVTAPTHQAARAMVAEVEEALAIRLEPLHSTEAVA
jgi:biotin carboxylase